MSNFFLLHVDIQFSEHDLLSFPHCMALTPCWKSFDYICEDLFLGTLFSSADHVRPYVSTTPLPPLVHTYCFDYCSFVVSFVWDLQLCSFQDHFSSLWSLEMPSKFSGGFFYFYKKQKQTTTTQNTIRIFIWIALSLWIALGGTDIWTVLKLPGHGHRMLLTLFVSSLPSFSSVL